MSEIPIAEGKILTLNNVLSRRLETLDQESIEKQAKMFEAYVKREGYEPYGPLILRDTTTDQGGSLSVVSEMLIQIKQQPKGVSPPYDFKPQIKVEGAVMARFNGPMRDLSMAYSKIQVYSYEKGISLGPVTYTIVAAQSPESGVIQADIFRKAV